MSEDEKEIFHGVKNAEKSNNKTKFGNVRENRGGGGVKKRVKFQMEKSSTFSRFPVCVRKMETFIFHFYLH